MLKSYFHKSKLEAGCDEAGRGCLAGPVTAAAVILPKKWNHPLLNDSKKMSAKHRNELKEIIMEEAIAYSINMVHNEEIDKVNILNASFIAMHRALDRIIKEGHSLELLLIDGNRFHQYNSLPHKCIIKGDGKYTSIAAASILAKTARDEYMAKMHSKYPIYHWESNKGYPTLAHRAAIEEHGRTPLHRKSFKVTSIHSQAVLFPTDSIE